MVGTHRNEWTVPTPQVKSKFRFFSGGRKEGFHVAGSWMAVRQVEGSDAAGEIEITFLLVAGRMGETLPDTVRLSV